MLSFLARRLVGARVMMVVAILDEELSAHASLEQFLVSPGQDRIERIALGALERADATRLVHAMSELHAMSEQPAGADHSLDAAIWALSRGHPFMIVEAMRMVRQGARSPAGGQAPPRVQEMITARLRHLGSQAYQLATIASVIGRPFDFALLRAASGLSDLRDRRSGGGADRRGVITVVGTQLDCTHDRIREVLRSALVPPVYKALHLAIARAIERFTPTICGRITGCSPFIFGRARTGRRPRNASKKLDAVLSPAARCRPPSAFSDRLSTRSAACLKRANAWSRRSKSTLPCVTP